MKTTREFNQSLKIEVLTHYGNGKLKCCQCGESRLDCLTIDHILNNGNTEDKRHRGGIALYRYLKQSKFPNGYQTLCMNCNIAKAILLKRSLSEDSIVLSVRVPGEVYLEMLKRAWNEKTTIGELTKKAILSDIDEDNS